MELNITNNEAQKRFETPVGDDFAYIDYRFHDGRMVLMHTFTPLAARGQGVSSGLAKFALAYLRENKMAAIVLCPFIKAYIKTHPEQAENLDLRYKL